MESEDGVPARLLPSVLCADLWHRFHWVYVLLSFMRISTTFSIPNTCHKDSHMEQTQHMVARLNR